MALGYHAWGRWRRGELEFAEPPQEPDLHTPSTMAPAKMRAITSKDARCNNFREPCTEGGASCLAGLSICSFWVVAYGNKMPIVIGTWLCRGSALAPFSNGTFDTGTWSDRAPRWASKAGWNWGLLAFLVAASGGRIRTWSLQSGPSAFTWAFKGGCLCWLLASDRRTRTWSFNKEET